MTNAGRLSERVALIAGGGGEIGAAIARPAVVKHSSGGRILFGALGGAIRATAKRVEQALCAAGIPCELSTDIRKAQWRKLLWNAPFCAISCLTRATVKEIVESDSLRPLAIDCMMESGKRPTRKALLWSKRWLMKP